MQLSDVYMWHPLDSGQNLFSKEDSYIMKHAREDYNRIQDPAGLIPDDEPVFLIRAKDACAPAAVLFWAAQAALRSADDTIVDAATRQARLMTEWQVKNGAKVPDMPV